jgi:hypothetical protein
MVLADPRGIEADSLGVQRIDLAQQLLRAPTIDRIAIVAKGEIPELHGRAPVISSAAPPPRKPQLPHHRRFELRMITNFTRKYYRLLNNVSSAFDVPI